MERRDLLKGMTIAAGAVATVQGLTAEKAEAQAAGGRQCGGADEAD
jgi:hypothetical protein